MTQAGRRGTLRYLAHAGGLAAVYFAAGELALLLAIPPGYAAAVWPAAGIALVVLLRFGWHLWPGVWLGSALVNIAPGLEWQAVTPGTAAVATAIGAGASLQAVAGAFLVRRFGAFPGAIARGREVLVLLGLGGPVSCVIGASVGVLTLWSAGLVPGSEALLNWLTWWVGDSIGVLIVTPLVLTLVGDPGELWRRRRYSVALPLGVTLLAVSLLFVYANSREGERIQLQFERRAATALEALRASLQGYVNFLYTVEGFFASTRNVSRSDFATFVQRPLSLYPGLHAVSWNPVIRADQRAAYEQAVREDGYPGFTLTERTAANELVVARARDEYVVVYYIEPMAGNDTALGYDIASDPTRLAALHTARDSGRPTATASITLVQETGEQSGTLVVLPVFTEREQATLEQRRRGIRGYAVVVLRIGSMVEAALSTPELAHITWRLWDATRPGTPVNLYSAASAVRVSASTGDTLHASLPLAFAGRDWVLELMPTPGFLAAERTWTGWLVLAAGLSLTGLLGGFLLALSGRADEIARINAELEQEVGERRRAQEELQRHRDHLEELVSARTAELAREIEESRSFNYAISHDLRSPLRAIDGYSRLLLEDFGEQLDGRARDYLERARAASQRMDKLIDALLALSRTARRKLRVEWVDLSELAEDRIERLRQQSPHRPVDFDASSGVRVAGDRQLLRMALDNLIDNAWKYTGKIARARIEFGTARMDGESVFYVRDNGAGFDMQFAHNLFGAFQRLHDASEFEGTGIGLATVQRIIARHGGRVWAESTVGKGATFYFTVPGQPPDA